MQTLLATAEEQNLREVRSWRTSDDG